MKRVKHLNNRQSLLSWSRTVKLNQCVCKCQLRPDGTCLGLEHAQTDLSEALLQAPEVQDKVQLLSPGVGQSHQAMEQLVHLIVQTRHSLHLHPVLLRHADAALIPAKP